MPSPRILNVTQLKCAVVDADWRRRWLAGDNPATTRPNTPDGATPVKGAVFHKIVEDFTSWLCRGRARKTARSLSTQETLWRECYQRFAESRLTELAETGQVESAHHLSRCLQSFCTRLSVLRREVPGFGDWQDLFLGAELPVEGVPVGDGGLCVSGRVEAMSPSTCPLVGRGDLLCDRGKGIERAQSPLVEPGDCRMDL